MRQTPRILTAAVLGPKVINEMLVEATARDGARLGRAPLEFIPTIPGVTKAPRHCWTKDAKGNDVLDVAAFLRWFCPSLDDDEAYRISRLPSAAAIKVEEKALKAFIELHAYRSELS